MKTPYDLLVCRRHIYSRENKIAISIRLGACIDLPRPTVLILTEYCPKGKPTQL